MGERDRVTRWQPGELIVRREINWGEPVIAWPVYVVSDSCDLLALFTPSGAPFSYSDRPYPHPSGRHPWWPKESWHGHGVLMLQRPGDAYAVWHFWRGPERDFSCWYLNLQDPFRRTDIGIDTEDHELDVVIEPDGTWAFKDVELLEERVAAGRYSTTHGGAIRAQGQQLASMIEANDLWWSKQWTTWSPPAQWPTPVPVDPRWRHVPWESPNYIVAPGEPALVDGQILEE